MMSDKLYIKKDEEEKECPLRINEGSNLLTEVYESLKNEWISECIELCEILEKVHVRESLFAADCIARQEYLPLLPSQCERSFINEEDSFDDTIGKAIKIVEVVKGDDEPLGLTVTIDEKEDTVAIERVLHGFVAHRSGVVNVGDQLCQVNGKSLKGKTRQEILDCLENECQSGSITFKLIPTKSSCHFNSNHSNSNHLIGSNLVVRALYDYNPVEDASHPCSEIGLSFTKGNILHIVNQDDPDWWQARKEIQGIVGEKVIYSRTGLIPGRRLSERRDVAKRDLKSHYDAERFIEIVPGLKTPFRKKYWSPRRVKKIMFDVSNSSELHRNEIVTYQSIVKYLPSQFTFRPVVLIGAEGVGRKEIIKQLLALRPGHFEQPIAHTDRKCWPGEIEGFDYYFVGSEFMEEEINLGHFVEYGRYKENWYGIHKKTITNIIKSGCVCLMNPHHQTLRNIYTAQFKPYIIHVKPPSDVQRLLTTRNTGHKEVIFTEDFAKQLVFEAQQLNCLFGQYFDVTIENDILNDTLALLIRILNCAEREAQWVPCHWTIETIETCR